MDNGMTNLDELHNSTKIDFISDIPVDIRLKILLSLPPEEAVRTCVLSKNWMRTWKQLPALNFDESLYVSKYGNVEGHNRFRDLIDGILYRHEGSVIRFCFSCERYEPSSLDRWIQILQSKRVECFHIQSTTGPPYRLPIEFLSCCHLKWVQLHNTVVSLPGTWSFPFLQHISLNSCLISTSELENLISSCVCLQNLNLNLCHGGINSCLNIRSKSLLWLNVLGSFFHVHLMTPSLTEARLRLCDHRLNIRPFKERICTVSLAEALGFVPNIHCLWISQSFLLTTMCTEFREPLEHLKELGLFVDFHDAWETRVAYSLMKQCPFLESLFIINSNKLKRMVIDLESREEATKNLSLKSLKSIQIEYFRRGSLSHLVNMALRTAPNLRELVFENPVEILTQEELHEYSWASPNCRVIVNQRFVIQAPPNQL